MLTGYLHRDYAASFLEFGTPRLLPNSQGWVLVRPIRDASSSCDAMGCYPLFCCVDWRALREDLTTCCEGLVSLVLVADPLGDYTPDVLRSTFDHVVPFKDHFVVETGRPLTEFVSKSHRAHAMRALKDVSVEVCKDPVTFIDDWQRLYGILALRHSISGLRLFSRAAFEKQLAIPGMVMFRAIANGETVGLDLWYEQGDCAQGHLAAFDSRGYELHASYATKWCAIDYFSDRVSWINLGAGTAGIGNPPGGLNQFKRGWSTGTKTAWLCGQILQPNIYTEIVKARGTPNEKYFPAYRSGEFE